MLQFLLVSARIPTIIHNLFSLGKSFFVISGPFPSFSLVACLRSLCIPVHTLLFELLIAAFVDRIADVLHEMIVEIKIMQDAQTHTEHLLRLEQVANICPAVMAAGRTLTSLLDRTVIQLIFGIKEVQLAVLCIDMSVTAVSGWLRSRRIGSR